LPSSQFLSDLFLGWCRHYLLFLLCSWDYVSLWWFLFLPCLRDIFSLVFVLFSFTYTLLRPLLQAPCFSAFPRVTTTKHPPQISLPLVVKTPYGSSPSGRPSECALLWFLQARILSLCNPLTVFPLKRSMLRTHSVLLTTVC